MVKRLLSLVIIALLVLPCAASASSLFGDWPWNFSDQGYTDFDIVDADEFSEDDAASVAETASAVSTVRPLRTVSPQSSVTAAPATAAPTSRPTVAPTVAPSASGRVFDEEHLFSEDEIRALDQLIQSIRSEYQMDAAVLTTGRMPTDNSEDGYRSWQWANNWYDSQGFGLGDDKAGLLFVIDMHNRWPVISTNGLMKDLTNDSHIDDLLNLCDSYLPSGRYGRCAAAVLQSLSGILAEAKSSGAMRFDADTGKRDTKLYNPLTQTEMLLALGAGVAVALAFSASVRHRYELRGSTYKYQAAENSQLHLSKDDQTFLRKSVTRTMNYQSSGSGGGSHHSGGGFSSGSHGGGTGHHF